MKVELKDNLCIVTREKGDPHFRDSGWGSGESRLLYHVKKILNARGFNLIKKRMCKDGHLMDEYQQYLRPRRCPDDPDKNIAILNERYSIEGANKTFSARGQVVLTIFRIT